jgi:hypothetical protein
MSELGNCATQRLMPDSFINPGTTSKYLEYPMNYIWCRLKKRLTNLDIWEDNRADSKKDIFDVGRVNKPSDRLSAASADQETLRSL